MHREDKVTKLRVTKLVLAFIHSEIENLRTETNSGNSSFYNTQMLYTAFAHKIAYKIYNSRNHEFKLKSMHNDVEMSILMGKKIKAIEVTIQKEEICYRKI